MVSFLKSIINRLKFFFCILDIGWWSGDDDEALVSLCQVHVQSDGSDAFDDRTLLALLATFKMHDFQIRQPVWGPSNTLIYLCEHPLKLGLKQSTIDQDLTNVIKNSGGSSKRFTWSCA